MRVVSSMGVPPVRPAQLFSQQGCDASSIASATSPHFGANNKNKAKAVLLAFVLYGGCQAWNNYGKPLKKAYNFVTNPFGVFGEGKPAVDTSNWYDGLIPQGPIITREEHINVDVTPLSSEPLKRLREDMEGGAGFLMLAHSVSLTDIARVYNALHSKQKITDEQLKQVCQDHVQNWNAIPKGTTFDLGQLLLETSTNVKQ